MSRSSGVTGRDTIRLGYVGGGGLAQRIHLPNFASLPDCELVALAEVREDLGRKVQAHYGIPRLYPDHRELIADPDIDAVGVSAAYALQGAIARDCLLAGKHVFMEKPMAVSVAQAEAILAASHQTGARLMIAYMKRHDPGNALARDVIRAWRASGEVGRPTYVRLHDFGAVEWLIPSDVRIETSSAPRPSPPTAENLPGWLPPDRAEAYLGYLAENCHGINLVRFLLDAGDRISVSAVSLDADGRAGVVLLDVDGIRTTFETGTLDSDRWDEHTQVYFERGWVHVRSPYLLQRNEVASVELYRQDPDGAPGILGQSGVKHTLTRAIAEPRWSRSYKNEAVSFIECLRTSEPFVSSGEDAVTDVRIAEEIYRQWLNR